MVLTVRELEILDFLSDTFSMLSVLGSIFILVSYFAYPHLRKFAFSLVAILSLNDLLCVWRGAGGVGRRGWRAARRGTCGVGERGVGGRCAATSCPTT
jgi:hypothetical protein